MKSDWVRVFVIFLIGLLIGVALGRLSSGRHYWKKLSPEARHEKKLKRFEKRLSLTPEQRDQVAVIIQEKRAKINGLREKYEPALAKVWKDSREEIRGLLKPEQIEKFEKMEKKWEKRWKKRHPHFHHPRPPSNQQK